MTKEKDGEFPGAKDPGHEQNVEGEHEPLSPPSAEGRAKEASRHLSSGTFVRLGEGIRIPLEGFAEVALQLQRQNPEMDWTDQILPSDRSYALPDKSIFLTFAEKRARVCDNATAGAGDPEKAWNYRRA